VRPPIPTSTPSGVGSPPIQITDRCAGEFDLRHALQLVERDGVSGCRLLRSEPGALEGTVDPIEQIGDVRRVRIEPVDRAAEQRARQRPPR
jgi:hypothetical protein